MSERKPVGHGCDKCGEWCYGSAHVPSGSVVLSAAQVEQVRAMREEAVARRDYVVAHDFVGTMEAMYVGQVAAYDRVLAMFDAEGKR